MSCPLHKSGRGDDAWSKHGTCSWCDSISGNEAMLLIEAGSPLIPTDNDTIAYVGHAMHKLVFHHLTLEQQRRLVTLIDEGKVNFTKALRRLPYFMKTK